jgi:hypothetical protein
MSVLLYRDELERAIAKAEQVFFVVPISSSEVRNILITKTAAMRLAETLDVIEVQHDGGGLIIGYGAKK